LAETKRIMISLPQKLLSEVDGVAAMEDRSRSEFIREAMKLYLQERNKERLRDRMQKGYQEMAGINLSLSQEAVPVENEAFKITEDLIRGK